ncbi:TOM1-like protein 2 isoform X7 [Siniperca chuatsi]|uniref:TOM1-like protein 2 isoform X7 n=1 Tax=Siniperca chuatsi TaxID=119488 RepID=UPI001CE0D046|nr:TOM1-like protein 2 isoform X7 [Siniperca chuatsi]
MEFLLGNPYSTPVGQCIERATDGGLQNEDWTLNMEICDIINETDEGPKDAMRALKKRLSGNKNYREVMLALTVLETCVKNCGHRFHVQVASRDFIDGVLVKIISPKTNPPTIVQDKVLSLIQAWADAFRSSPDLTGVVHIYEELKRKGIEFPMADLDALSPIHTPQRGTPEVDPAMIKYLAPASPAAGTPAPSPSPASATQVPNMPSPITATPEQIARLRSELDIVRGNTKVMSEMLTEMVPGQEDASDLELLQMLNEATEDNLIDLGPGSPAVVTPRITSSPPPHSTANAAASPAHNPTTASLSSALAGLDVASDSVSGTQSSLSGPNQDDFDMFAQTRSSSLAEQRKNVKYEDPQALGGLASALDVRQQNAGGKGDATEEGVTSEEFDKFLEERAKAVDSVPSPPRANPAHPARTPGGSHKKAERTEDALFAL